MVGRSERELAGRPLFELIHPDDRAYFLAELTRLREGKAGHAAVDLRYVVDPGRPKWCRIHLSAGSLPDRTGAFIIGLVEEINRQKENEERLIASRSAVEEAYRRIEGELEEAERARLASESAVQAKADFLANMSHEIRTPIHTVIGMSELLTETHLDAEQQEYAAQIQFAAEVLLSLVNDVLDYSKIEAGRLGLESIDFDLHKMAGEAVDLVSLEAHRKGVEVILFIENDVPQFVRGDPVRLRQIVINLFNNAVKFTPHGEIVVSIMKILEADSRVRLHFFVKDTGVGIPADKRSRLFQVFSQVDSSTTRKYGGTGLGLSISKSLVELMGGEIGVESREGVGSTFWFSLEFDKSDRPPEAAWNDSTLLAGTKVLVVDDNASARIVVARCLEGWGCLVDQVDGGPQALSALRSAAAEGKPYHLCLSDLLMPGMDGWQLASEINADKRINATKLILLSPAGKGGDEAKMKLLGWFDGYLSKPVKRGLLFDMVRRVAGAEIDLESVEEPLPVDDREPDVAAAAIAAVAPRAFRVLVAEDHEVNRHLFETILRSLGYSVELAANGREALEAVSADPHGFALVFMDVQMPEVNGYEASKGIRAAGIEVPIVAVTASVSESERERCREAGMSDFLGKPFRKRDIVPVLERWIGGAAPTPDSATDRSSSGRPVDPPPAPAAAAEAKAPEARIPPSIDPAIFDLGEAVSTFLGKSDVVERMVQAFVDRVERQLPKIRNALSADDLTTARAEAHSIKGGGWNLQIRRVGDAAAKLESAAVEGDREAAERALGRLEAAFDELKRALEPLLTV